MKIKLIDMNNLKVEKEEVIDDGELILNKLFPNYETQDFNFSAGAPDYKLVNKNDKNDYFWVELKRENDGLRETQISWMIKNKKDRIKVLYINNKNYIEKSEEEKNKEQEGVDFGEDFLKDF